MKKKFFTNTSSPVTGTDADYSPFHDVDASGWILARDYSEVKKRFFQSLPQAVPGGDTAAAAGAFSVRAIRPLPRLADQVLV